MTPKPQAGQALCPGQAFKSKHQDKEKKKKKAKQLRLMDQDAILFLGPEV